MFILVDNIFFDEEIEFAGGSVHHLVPKTSSYLKYKECLKHLIRGGHYEYVMRVTSNAVGYYDLKVAKDAGARVCTVRSSNASDGGDWKVKALHVLSRMFFQRYVDVKIAPSDLAAEYTFGKDAVRRGEVRFLRNTLDLDVYKFSADNRAKIRQEFRSDNKLVVGHVGRFSKQKNHEFLIEVFKEIKDKRKDAVLLLVGKGELQDIVKKGRNIRFAG